MRFKQDIDKVRDRLYAFWEGEYTGRACISIVAPKYEGANISLFHNDKDLSHDPLALKDYWENPEVIYQNTLKKFERTFFGGEAIPIAFQNYGTSGHCNYYGAKPVYGSDTIWFDPVWDSLEDAENSYDGTTLEKHLAIAQYLTENAKDNFFVGMPDSCGTLDAIAHLYSMENLLYDMILQPDKVKKVVSMLNKGWEISNERFYKISKDHNQGGAHAWMHLLAPGRVAQMQCDLSVMISEEMFSEFVLPELEQQIEWIDYPVYHFDGIEQVRHLPYLLGMEKLKAIQWTEVAGQPSAAHFIPVLKQIQDAGKGLIIMAPLEDIKILLQNLSANRLYIHTIAKNQQEAQDVIEYVEKNSVR